MTVSVLTREYFDEGIANLASKRDLQALRQEMNERFQAMQQEMNVRFEQVDIKLDAMLELLAHRKELYNLVRELKAKGVEIDETKVFVS